MSQYSLYSYIGKKVFFGAGHFAFPDTRYSVGCRVVNDMAEILGVRWKDHPEAMCYTAESDYHFLVKPKHFKENGVSLAAFMHCFQIPNKDVTFIHDDIGQLIGNYGKGTPGVDNHWVLSAHNFSGQDIRKVAVGIAPSGPFYDVRLSVHHPLKLYRPENHFFRNVFNREEEEILKKMDLATVLLEESLEGDLELQEEE